MVTHWITNNPNDQLRPEDLENEAATGRKPSYKVEANDVWKSIKPCYEGDGDVIDTEEGSVDPTFLGVGTVFKNTPFAGANLVGASDPALLSSDLIGGFTNAYYTTIERDPFEWSYRKAGTADNVFEFFGLPLPDPNLAGQLVSGPRWRLKANKFGQDLPGLEIPRVECTPPPYEKGDIKYEVGALTTTVINLLDWEAGVPSPLATSKGWIDYVANGENVSRADRQWRTGQREWPAPDPGLRLGRLRQGRQEAHRGDQCAAVYRFRADCRPAPGRNHSDSRL